MIYEYRNNILIPSFSSKNVNHNFDKNPFDFIKFQQKSKYIFIISVFYLFLTS